MASFEAFLVGVDAGFSFIFYNYEITLVAALFP